MSKILIVDDSEDSVFLLSQLLQELQYEVVTAFNGLEGIRAAEREKPELILLDVEMPLMNGFEVCERLRGNPATKDIPIIFLTANTKEEDVVRGLELGGDDYVTKPFNLRVLEARIRTALRAREAKQRIEELALTDPLTGLYNRRFFARRLEEEISRAKRNGTSVALLMLDIDHFKMINDTFGHDFGDQVLKGIASTLRSCFRMHDAVVRYGGEEFVVLLGDASEAGARRAGEKIREEVERQAFYAGGAPVSVTVSVGVFGTSGGALLQEAGEYTGNADVALYEAKESGRNRVVVRWQGNGTR